MLDYYDHLIADREEELKAEMEQAKNPKKVNSKWNNKPYNTELSEDDFNREVESLGVELKKAAIFLMIFSLIVVMLSKVM